MLTFRRPYRFTASPGQAALAPFGCLVLAGCSGPLSILDPVGSAAASTATLWWVMLAGAAIILAAMMGLILLAFTPWRRRLSLPVRVWLVGGGLVFPSVTLTALLAAALLIGENMLPHARSPEAMRIEAVARQWNWSFRYPQAGGVESAGILYLPAGRPVDIHVTTQDVIHSFWVPRLAGKIDAVPGHVNVVRLLAPYPGIFAGQCAEFCGVGHTGMSFVTEALPDDAFEDRLRQQPGIGEGEP